MSVSNPFTRTTIMKKTAKKRAHAKSPSRKAGQPISKASKKNSSGRSFKQRKVVEHVGTDVAQGSGGESHQMAEESGKKLTTAHGMVVADNQNTLTAGSRGPQLLEDFILREKIFRFDHERIPERVVHARGYGARGYFEVTDDLADVSSAGVFQPGRKTDVFVRFSTVAGNKGSADLARDVRGFAVKFYTDEGNWDLVGNNIPVFFIQDAIKFPDLVHAAKAEPDRGFPQAQTAHDNFWDFISLMPEAMHMVMWSMSDRGIPRSFRFMEGFGVHTFRLITAAGKSTYVKFHWKPALGLQSVTWNEALKINGADPDYHRRDLWNAIEDGNFPEWTLGVQLFDDDFADEFEFDVLDATKLIPEEQVPVRTVGKMVLNSNVDNFFAETEQVAFCTQNIVPGIDFTNDPLLQGRNFSYLDTQLKRLGSPNFTQIPVNAPRCPMAHLYQDGHMATNNPTGRTNYEPNSRSEEGLPRECPGVGFVSHPEEAEGRKERVRSETFADHYSQAIQFYKSQTETEQTHIVEALVFELSKVDDAAIRRRMLASLLNVDDGLAKSVASGLGIDSMPTKTRAVVKPRTDLAESDALSILKNVPGTFDGRAIGALISSGVDAKALKALKRAAWKEGAQVKYVALTREGIVDSEGNSVKIDEKVNGGPSVLFDAIAVLATDDGAEDLMTEPTAHDFVKDAHAHKKFVFHTRTAAPLFVAAGIDIGSSPAGYTEVRSAKSASAFVEACRALRCWDRTLP